MKKNDYVAHESIGIYAKDVKMVNMARVEDHEYAQCGFKVENGNVNFYSYSSLLFRLPLDEMINVSDRVECRCHFTKIAPNYSRTTIMHTRYFANQLNSSAGYHMLKEIYNTGDNDCFIYVDKKEIDKIVALYENTLSK